MSRRPDGARGSKRDQRVPDQSLHQHPSNQVHLVHDATENVDYCSTPNEASFPNI